MDPKNTRYAEKVDKGTSRKEEKYEDQRIKTYLQCTVALFLLAFLINLITLGFTVAAWKTTNDWFGNNHLPFGERRE